jgi:YidC/Oxa1 family membrane protein insertase
MMNSIMNFMPLTVVFFGWSFASGPVLYWATQSIYSVVQQWFITGWGNFIKWAPFLPELPEHRRLGYRPPRNLDEVVVVSGDGTPVYAPGPMGWFQRKMEEAQQQALQRSGGLPSSDGKANASEEETAPAVKTTGNGAAHTSGNARGRGAKSGKGKKGAAAPRAQGNGAAASSLPAGAVIVPRKAKPAGDGHVQRSE